jgi:LppP/LprE lipoprotein
MRAPLAAAAALLALAAAGAGAGPAPAAKSVPSRARAQGYAHRTYVNDSVLGRRRFSVIGRRVAVRSADGSTLTAFSGVLDSADGTGEIVLLFRGNRFLGWASAYDTVHLAVGRAASSISVHYGVFSGNDPFCCPHAIKTVHYRWNGRRILADGTPPRSFGRKGSRLHLSPA